MSKPGLNYTNRNSVASHLLDLLRFIAAFTVVIYHFGVPPHEFGNQYIQLTYDIIRGYAYTGYQFVMVFFVLSGYFIASNVMKMINENRWSWKAYLVNRLTRLWVVLIPSLILTCFWAIARVNLFGGELNESFRWDLFFGNMFFFQHRFIPIYGNNDPLWSLTFEFWYYILFPCIVLIFRSKHKLVKIGYFIFALALGMLLGERIMSYFIIWLLGALLVFVKPVSIAKKLRPIILLASVILASVSLKLLYVILETPSPTFTNDHFIPDLSVGVAFLILTYIIICLFNDTRLKRFSLFAVLGGFSYTLYLTHFPILTFVKALLGEDRSFSLFTVIIWLITIPFTVLFAFVVSRITENRTEVVRKFISGLLQDKKETRPVVNS